MTKLKHAKESLQEQAALRSQQRESIPLMDEYYKNLFKTIAKGNEKQAVGWAYCLTEGELCLLCDIPPSFIERLLQCCAGKKVIFKPSSSSC